MQFIGHHLPPSAPYELSAVAFTDFELVLQGAAKKVHHKCTKNLVLAEWKNTFEVLLDNPLETLSCTDTDALAEEYPLFVGSIYCAPFARD
jgi:hypothetical protein